MTSKKQNQFEKLGIHVSVSRIASGFDRDGINSSLNQQRDELLGRLLSLKKDKMTRPERDFVTVPKNPPKGVSEEEHKKLREEYELKKANHDKKIREYESFSSERYVKSSLAYKLTKKVEKLITILSSEKLTTEQRTEQSNVIFKQLEGGIIKPVFKQGSGTREYVMKYTDLYPVPKDVVGLQKLLSVVGTEYKDTNELFARKSQLKQEALRFSPAMRAGVAYILQEALNNLIDLAYKNASENHKQSLNIENFAPSVLRHSPFWTLFCNLPIVNELYKYISRREEYEKDVEETKSTRSKSKLKQKYVKIVSFYEIEKKEGHMKEVNNRRIWPALSSDARSDNFLVIINKLFDLFKEKKKDKKKKLRIADRAREFLAQLVSQFLSQLSMRFDIYRKHKCKIEPTINHSERIRPEEKSIKFETVISIFEMILCSQHETVTAVINTACQFKGKFKSVRQDK